MPDRRAPSKSARELASRSERRIRRAWEHRDLVTERDWQRVASDAICRSRRFILSVPPDLAVAGGPASIVPVLARPGRVVHVEANRPSSLAEYPPRRWAGPAVADIR